MRRLELLYKKVSSVYLLGDLILSWYTVFLTALSFRVTPMPTLSAQCVIFIRVRFAFTSHKWTAPQNLCKPINQRSRRCPSSCIIISCVVVYCIQKQFRHLFPTRCRWLHPRNIIFASRSIERMKERYGDHLCPRYVNVTIHRKAMRG